MVEEGGMGETREEGEYAVWRGVLQIQTTLDPIAQIHATVSRNDVLAELSPEGTLVGPAPLAPKTITVAPRYAHGLVVYVDPTTGAIRADLKRVALGTRGYVSV